MARPRNTHSFTVPLRTMLLALLALLAIFASSCGSNREAPDQAAKETETVESELPKPATDEITPPAADTMYSDAPKCNARVKRIADEMLPCLQRIKPEMGKQLQAVVDTFRNSPRLRLDPVHRDEVILRVEEDCQSYWLTITNQLDSKSPEGQCQLDMTN